MGEPFGFVTRFHAIDACFKSKDSFNTVHDLAGTPLKDYMMYLYMRVS